MNNTLYVSYNDYEVVYDTQEHVFTISVKNVKGILRSEHISDSPVLSVDRKLNHEENILSVVYKAFTVTFVLNRDGIAIKLPFCLDTYLKTTSDTFSMRLENSEIVNAAFGPAVSKKDNCLFDRSSDSALCVNGRFGYDFARKCYTCRLNEDTFLSLKENILATEYGMDYGKINKNCTFPTPPAGWMTWYAVKFDASEELVLRNVNWQKEHLKDFGANVIWVDWEWYHKDFSGIRDDGVDTFHPDPKKYPKGLKYIADKIREAGFIPALWIGFANDSSHNQYTREHPEIILTQKASWCGQYFYDFSHPKYLEEFLPMALKQVFDWGYEAVKFDTLPISIRYHEMFHQNMYDPSLTTKDAFRNVIKKTREVLGEHMYMISCAAEKDTDLLWASDLFDGARVGGDIFTWPEFLKEGVGRILKFYPMNNTIFYTDPDNVVLREEFNTYEQAASRAYFVSMLGLPLNLGDDLPLLPKDRVDLLKECLPTLDIHPMSLKNSERTDVLITNLHIALPIETYNVISVFNTTEQKAEKQISLPETLELDEGEYLVFDYTSKRFMGELSSLPVTLEPCETRIYCIRKKKGGPQLLSTSRHITQGAAEIKNLYEIDNTIVMTASLIKDYPHDTYWYVPDNYSLSCETGETAIVDKNIYKISFVPCETKDYEITFIQSSII